MYNICNRREVVNIKCTVFPEYRHEVALNDNVTKKKITQPCDILLLVRYSLILT